jgi:membrane protease YdiL (CAAX protease family)
MVLFSLGSMTVLLVLLVLLASLQISSSFSSSSSSIRMFAVKQNQRQTVAISSSSISIMKSVRLPSSSTTTSSSSSSSSLPLQRVAQINYFDQSRTRTMTRRSRFITSPSSSSSLLATSATSDDEASSSEARSILLNCLVIIAGQSILIPLAYILATFLGIAMPLPSSLVNLSMPPPAAAAAILSTLKSNLSNPQALAASFLRSGKSILATNNVFLTNGIKYTLPLLCFASILELVTSRRLTEVSRSTQRTVLDLLGRKRRWVLAFFVSAMLGTIAGVGEELLFRGVFQVALTKYLPKLSAKAFILSSKAAGVYTLYTPAQIATPLSSAALSASSFVQPILESVKTSCFDLLSKCHVPESVLLPVQAMCSTVSSTSAFRLFEDFLPKLTPTAPVSFASGMAMVLTSLFFGAMHNATNLYSLLAFIVSLYFGALYNSTGSLQMVAFVHGLYDFIALLWAHITVTSMTGEEQDALYDS